MTKTKEELNSLKQEYKTLTSKLNELSEEELNMVTGGIKNTSYIQAILAATGFTTFMGAEGNLIQSVNQDDLRKMVMKK